MENLAHGCDGDVLANLGLQAVTLGLSQRERGRRSVLIW